MRFNEIHRSLCVLLFTLTIFAVPVDAQIFTDTAFWPATEGGNDHFYQIVAMPMSMSWAEADAIANSSFGHLVSITSQEENDFVFGLIAANPTLCGDRGPWIGAFQDPSAVAVDEGWQWTTGEVWTFSDWALGEPSGNQGVEDHTQDFGHYNCANDGSGPVSQWNDIELDGRNTIHAFIIEYSDITLHSMKMRRTVDPDRNDQFFQAVVIGGGVAWTTARDMAEAMGGHLATLTSLEENNWVFNNIVNDPALWTFSNDAKGPWIGGIQTGGPEPGGGWEWVTGEAWAYTNWKSGQPDNAPPGEDYLHFFNIPDEIIANQWNDIWDEAGFSIISFVVEYNDFCVADTNKDRLVNVTDLLNLLAAWGPCP